MHTQKGNIPPQGLEMIVGAISGPTAKLDASFGAISPTVDIHGCKKHSGKADQLTLASGSGEHA